jgi:hypothetical protein
MKLSFKEFLDVIEAATTTAQTSAPQSSGGGGYSQRLFGGYESSPEFIRRKKKRHTSEGKYGDKVDGGYESSPVLVDKDEFVGNDAAKQAKDCGLAMCPHQLGVGRMMTDKRTTNKRLRNQENDLPINNSKPKK